MPGVLDFGTLDEIEGQAGHVPDAAMSRPPGHEKAGQAAAASSPSAGAAVAVAVAQATEAAEGGRRSEVAASSSPASQVAVISSGGGGRVCCGETIEVVARHAIQELEVKVRVPARAKFKHIKMALAKCLGSDEITKRGQLMKKERGIYSAFKDVKQIGGVRQVLVICTDFAAVAELARVGGEVQCSLGEEEISSDEKAVESSSGAGAARAVRTAAGAKGAETAKQGPFTRERAIEMQLELLEGFSGAEFQRRFKSLEKKRNGGGLSKSEFAQERQKLLLTVQAAVLPKFGFEGTTSGVYKMMGSTGPFLQDPDFTANAKRINELISLESPPETWHNLTNSCKKLQAVPAESPAAQPKARPKMSLGNTRLGLGLLGTLGGPSLLLGELAAPPPASRERSVHAPALEAQERSTCLEKILAESPCRVEDLTASPAPSAVAAESRAEQGTDFEPWPASRPPPITLSIAGSFNGNSPVEMDWDPEGGLFVYTVQAGSSGTESFQLLVDGSRDKMLSPSVQNAGPFKPHTILGPDSKGGKSWCMGCFAEEEVRPGGDMAIMAALDSRGTVRIVDWQPL